VAVVVVPQSLAGAYAAISVSDVAGTIYVPDGANVRLHSGAMVAGGDGLGAADDVLVVIGMLVITSPVTGPVPQRIYVIGSVLAPRGSEALLGPAMAGGSGSVSYYPRRGDENVDVKVLSGQVRLSGAVLANPSGQESDILIAAGQVAVTGEVGTLGYRLVVVAGQFAAPAAGRDALEPFVQVQGQAGWYQGSNPRVFYQDTTLGPDFFRLLGEPVSLVVFGDLTIAHGVTEDMVREKVTGLVLFGDATAPAGIVAVLQVLAGDMFGEIRASDGLRS
jgi:hypothetical protein